MTRKPIGERICPVDVVMVKDFMGIPQNVTHRDAFIYHLLMKNMNEVEEYANVSLSAYNVDYEIAINNFLLPYQPVDAIQSIKSMEGVSQSYQVQQDGSIKLDAMPEGGVIVKYTTKALNDVRKQAIEYAICQLVQMDYDGNTDRVSRIAVLQSILENINGI